MESSWTILRLMPLAKQLHWKTEERFGQFLHEHFDRKVQTHIQTKQFYFPKTFFFSHLFICFLYWLHVLSKSFWPKIQNAMNYYIFSSSKEMSYGSFNFVQFHSVRSCPQPLPFKPVITMPQIFGFSIMFKFKRLQN